LGASRRGKAAKGCSCARQYFAALPALFRVSSSATHAWSEVTPGADIVDWGPSGVGLPLQAAAVIYVEVASVVHCCFYLK
jgi:hypothetical protein